MLTAVSMMASSCLGEEHSRLATAFFQVIVQSDKVIPEPLFLQAKQPQHPQPLVIGHA